MKPIRWKACLLGAAVATVATFGTAVPAREAPEPGVTGKLIADAARSAGHPAVTYVPEKADLVDAVVGMSEPGDVILTLGAGDIWRQNRAIAQRLIDMETEGAS